jgi:hypothetical protein
MTRTSSTGLMNTTVLSSPGSASFTALKSHDRTNPSAPAVYIFPAV